MKINALFTSLTLLGLVSSAAHAQTSASLSANNIDAGFTANGGLFQDEHYWGKFRIKDADRIAIFAGSTWISGMVNGQLRAALQDHYLLNDTSGLILNGSDFSAGPIADSYSATSYNNRYNRVWEISRDEIDYHRSNVGKTTYFPSPPIAEWPANGDVSNGEAKVLAPFVDLDGDSLYEPLEGDYPLIRGDQAVYVIFNDDQQQSSLSTTSPLQAEIHLLAYAYDSANFPALHNTIFTHLRVINRSSTPIDSLVVSNWTDVDLGNSGDDLFASDSARNMIYFYNADLYDEGPMGFGANPPAVGIMNLSENAGGHTYYHRTGSAFVPVETTEPTIPAESRNYMLQKWRNGHSLIAERPSGDGFVANNQGSVTSWVYDNSLNWKADLLRADVRNVFSSTPVSLAAGAELCINHAYIYARDTATADLFASANLLEVYADEIQQFHNNTSGNDCLERSSIAIAEGFELKEAVQLYPNPTSGSINIDLGAAYANVNIEVMNSTGQVVSRFADKRVSKRELEINGPAGIYFVKIGAQGQVSTVIKIIKQQ